MPEHKGLHRRRRIRSNRRLWLASAGITLSGFFLFHVWHASGEPSNLSTTRTPPHTLPSKNTTDVNTFLTAPTVTAKTSPPVSTLAPSALLHVPIIPQLPELPNGCEITSLSMLLSAVGHPIDKMTLAKEMPKDTTKEVFGPGGSIISWGNPNVGFVGNVYEGDFGYGIYHGPLFKFLNQLFPNQAVDLTGKSFTDILQYVADGTPVELWTTATFQPTTLWETWKSPEGPVHATMEEHAVLLVGYNATTLFINNPLNGEQAQPVNRQSFIAAWKQLGEQALTLSPET